jgi:hypothetical protein
MRLKAATTIDAYFFIIPLLPHFCPALYPARRMPEGRLYEGLNPTDGELVDGSDPFYTESLLRLFALEILDCTYFGLIGEHLKRGSEQSTKSEFTVVHSE